MSSTSEHDELLRRLDRHMDKQDAMMGRMETAFECNTRAFDRNTEAFERNTRAWGHTVAAFKAIETRLEDMGDQIRANTQAVLKALDGLDNGGASA